MPSLGRIGAWAIAYKYLNKSTYVTVIRTAPDRALKKAAMMLERQIKKGLARGTLELAPLSPGYLARKLAEGYSPNPLLRTGEAMRTVTTRAVKNGYFIGVPRGVRRHSYGAKDDVMNIMKLHHDGIGQVERPFIINAYNQISKDIKKMIGVEITKSLGFK